jgi:large subunit ribosomal protein L4
MKVPVYNIEGKQVGEMPIDEIALGETINPALIKQAYVMYHANLRRGTSKTLNRSAVAFSHKKMYKQKGTGNARHGDKTAVQFRKGGHAHSKKRDAEHYKLDMPKKMKRKANRSAFLSKLLDNEVRVIDRLGFPEPKTKAVVAFLDAIKVDKTALVALPSDEKRGEATRLAARNVEGVTLCRADQLTAWTMLNSRYLVIDRADLEAWLTGPTSQTGKDAKLAPKGARAAEEAR